MNKLIGVALFAAGMCISTSVLADELVSENRVIDARVVKVRLDGVIDLRLKQGPAASLVISGDKRLVAKVTTVQSGDTLMIDTESRGIHFGNNKSLHAELTVPNLQEFISRG